MKIRQYRGKPCLLGTCRAPKDQEDDKSGWYLSTTNTVGTKATLLRTSSYAVETAVSRSGVRPLKKHEPDVGVESMITNHDDIDKVRTIGSVNKVHTADIEREYSSGSESLSMEARIREMVAWMHH